MTYSTNQVAIKARERYHNDEEYRLKVLKRSSEWNKNAKRNGWKPMWEKTHKKEFSIIQKKSQRKIRLEVLTHYSNGSPKCKHCGIEDVRVLTIDHINNDGAKHRKELGSLGTRLYHWLKKQGYPEGFQVLCFNCNWIKRLEMD